MVATVAIQHGRSNEAQLTYAPNAAVVSDGFNILFDGKVLTADNSNRWDDAGTGTASYSNNKVSMSVDSGEYQIRQSTRRMPYFAGYPIYPEMTFDGFANDPGVTKRVGYFSSSTTAPYTANLDGFWLEADGTTYRMVAYRDGTETVNVPIDRWTCSKNNAEPTIIDNYDWDNFTAVMFDFLWLGGAALRMWLCTAKYGWILAHTVPYVGNATNTVTLSPQQPLRYEIRGDSAAGSMRPMCGQVSTLGDVAGKSEGVASVATTSVACNATNTIYALQGIKLNSTYLDLAARVSSFSSVTTSTNDTGNVLLLKNPTLSAGLSYSAYGRVDRAHATNQTVTAVGTVLNAAPSSRTSQGLSPDNYLAWLTKAIDGTADEFVLAFQPATTNQSVRATLVWQEYS